VCTGDACAPCGGADQVCCGNSCLAPYVCQFRMGPDFCVLPMSMP
jgi:hypothetical protein